MFENEAGKGSACLPGFALLAARVRSLTALSGPFRDPSALPGLQDLRVVMPAIKDCDWKISQNRGEINHVVTAGGRVDALLIENVKPPGGSILWQYHFRVTPGKGL